jgi:histidyl-tRNA synthetase
MQLELAKGTRDFLPEEKIVRDKIMGTLKEACETFGFSPIETPVIERYETLTAKFAAGEESDAMKETFRLKDQGERPLGLRFDLTVPFSRFIALNKNSLKMPFKKYIVGEVFRDGPLKAGRYRQFTQFDPDIVGCKDMIADAEVIALADYAFKKLEFEFEIELNNKKILLGVLQDAGIDEMERFSVLVSVDKLKKIGVDGVKKELKEKLYEDKEVDFILNLLKKESSNEKTIEKLKKNLKSFEGQEGIKELEQIFAYLNKLGVKSVVFEPSLVRGLGYYTGPIFEVFLKNSSLNVSAAGGGRFDKMIGDFLGTDEEYPAVGFSFGVEVLFEAYKEKNKLEKKTVTDLYIIPIGLFEDCFDIVSKFRENGIKVDFDLLKRGVSKNLNYANSYGIPFVAFIGEQELEQEKIKLKNMKTGEEKLVSVEGAIEIVRSGCVH